MASMKQQTEIMRTSGYRGYPPWLAKKFAHVNQILGIYKNFELYRILDVLIEGSCSLD